MTITKEFPDLAKSTQVKPQGLLSRSLSDNNPLLLPLALYARGTNGNTMQEEQSEKFQIMASRTERYGQLEHPDGFGTRTGECGDTINMYLSIRGNQIQMVTFTVNGCSNTVACGNTVSFLMEGRAVQDGWELSPENVADYLETLPKDHFHCAELAVGAFYKALASYNKLQTEKWKQAYPSR